ncbi:hypothetical protein [Clostridium saccharoperbutylacetonicum]|nr:hypothetical protein [Clostridium saccharoperbutylacetonicum]AQR96415.1 hypothetical protein CLSAP_37390 [Clostridium saccharoperbutylacetonicum]NSB32288.1 hypothetical protein [Clostridium saccharoperbutylacetonicum]
MMKKCTSTLESGIVFERHRVLYWPIGKGTDNDDLDFVSTDTY